MEECATANSYQSPCSIGRNFAAGANIPNALHLDNGIGNLEYLQQNQNALYVRLPPLAILRRAFENWRKKVCVLFQFFFLYTILKPAFLKTEPVIKD